MSHKIRAILCISLWTLLVTGTAYAENDTSQETTATPTPEPTVSRPVLRTMQAQQGGGVPGYTLLNGELIPNPTDENQISGGTFCQPSLGESICPNFDGVGGFPNPKNIRTLLGDSGPSAATTPGATN